MAMNEGDNFPTFFQVKEHLNYAGAIKGAARHNRNK